MSNAQGLGSSLHTGLIPERDAIKLTEFKRAILWRADRQFPGLIADGREAVGNLYEAESRTDGNDVRPRVQRVAFASARRRTASG